MKGKVGMPRGLVGGSDDEVVVVVVEGLGVGLLEEGTRRGNKDSQRDGYGGKPRGIEKGDSLLSPEILKGNGAG